MPNLQRVSRTLHVHCGLCVSVCCRTRMRRVPSHRMFRPAKTPGRAWISAQTRGDSGLRIRCAACARVVPFSGESEGRGAPRAAVSLHMQSNMNIEAERDRKNTRALDRTEVHDFHASHYGKPMIHFGRIHLFGELNQVKTTATDCRGSSRVVRLTVSRCRELSARDRT